MSRGYICIAQNSGVTNYLEQAYALALSIQLTQSTVKNISVCVDKNTMKQVTNKHRKVFDRIIEIPWDDAAENESWKIHNKWKYYYMTPYDETVILDTDMIFPSDISYWWDIMSQQDVWATTNVVTYRGETVTSTYYREYFDRNNLPNIYTAFFYFKKSELATELFNMIEIVFQHWQRMFYDYMPAGKPEFLSGDVAFALAIQLLGIEHLCTRINTQIPTFVHMKTHVQNIKGENLSEDWTDCVPTYYAAHNNFKIGNFVQTLPFHYTVKTWLTDEMIAQMEKEYE